jgi:hypothetical protein
MDRAARIQSPSWPAPSRSVSCSPARSSPYAPARWLPPAVARPDHSPAAQSLLLFSPLAGSIGVRTPILPASPASFAAAACALGAVWSMHARRRQHARLLRRRLIARTRRRHCARRRRVRICGSRVALALISIWRGSHRRHSAPNRPAPSQEVCPHGRLRCARARRRQAAP